MFGACFYTEHAKPRNVCFQRHFAKAGLYIVPTHVILVSNNRSTENKWTATPDLELPSLLKSGLVLRGF